LHLAGREADGAILNWLGAGDVAQCAAEVGAGKTIAARIFVIPNEDADTARFIARRMISSYLTVRAYAEFQRWLGRSDVLAPMWDAWAAGDRKKANEVIPDSVVDELVVHGSVGQCRAHIQRYIDAGVQIPSIAIVPFGVDLEEVVRGLAP
jgi:alkanesulfonate monooxygenase SsuD/methylene tetrahydromethanopterin reductase-like flavin-dependent oxidoreductase (luciferase family)